MSTRRRWLFLTPRFPQQLDSTEKWNLETTFTVGRRFLLLPNLGIVKSRMWKLGRLWSYLPHSWFRNLGSELGPLCAGGRQYAGSGWWYCKAWCKRTTQLITEADLSSLYSEPLLWDRYDEIVDEQFQISCINLWDTLQWWGEMQAQRGPNSRTHFGY